MKTRILYGLFIILLALSCNKDDEVEHVTQNKAPSALKLISPGENAKNESRTPNFSWDEAIDPDGDKVTYDLYFGKQGESSSLLAETLAVNSFTSTERLDFYQEYQWKVVAKDIKGASTSSSVRSFFVQPTPIVFLRRHGIGTTDEYYEYSDEQDLLGLEDAKGNTWGLQYDTTTEKLERSYRSIESAFQYDYSKEGMQETVGEFSIGKSEGWMLEYENPYESLTKIFHEIRVNGITKLDEEATFVYEDKVSTVDTNAPKLVQIQIGSVTDSGTISKKIDVEWIGKNIGKIRVELDSPEGFVFSFQLEYEYDNNVNPYYIIIKEQFGFDSFYVSNFETGLETINFGPFYWQSQNNITKIKKTEQDGNGIRYTNELTYDYTYSEDYYPTLANVVLFSDITSLEYMEEWSY